MNDFTLAGGQWTTDGKRSPSCERTVYVVDDDPEVSGYIDWLLRSAGWRVRTFRDAKTFLDAYVDEGPACLLTDVYMPGLSGLELQEVLAARGVRLPIVMMSGQADIPTAVRAIRGGATDFLEKPFDGPTLIGRLRAELDRAEECRDQDEERERAAAALAGLTPRQRQVLEGLTAGKISKIIASDLGVSTRTIDVHRFRLMQRLGAQSLSDLFRLVYLAAEKPVITSPGRERAERLH